MLDVWPKLLLTYGPFALLVFFVFILEKRARALTSQQPNQWSIGHMIYGCTWIGIFALGIVIVFVWIQLNVPVGEAVIRGRLIGLGAGEKFSSPFEQLYIRQVYETKSRADFVWRIISDRKLPAGTPITIYLDRSRPEQEDISIYSLPIAQDFYDHEVDLRYDIRTRHLMVVEPKGASTPLRATQASVNQSERPQGFLSRLANSVNVIVMAQSTMGRLTMAKRLEADDPVVRLEARSDLASMGKAAVVYIDQVLSEPSSSYRLKLGVLYALNALGTTGGGDQLSAGAKCAIVSLASDKDPSLQEQATIYIASHTTLRQGCKVLPVAPRTASDSSEFPRILYGDATSNCDSSNQVRLPMNQVVQLKPGIYLHLEKIDKDQQSIRIIVDGAGRVQNGELITKDDIIKKLLRSKTVMFEPYTQESDGVELLWRTNTKQLKITTLEPPILRLRTVGIENGAVSVAICSAKEPVMSLK